MLIDTVLPPISLNRVPDFSRAAEDMASTRCGPGKQIAFYASTPSHRRVVEYHGWGQAGEELSRLAARGNGVPCRK